MKTLLPLILTILFSQAAFAYGEYYVEVGSELEEEEAMGKWRELSKKYPDTLGTLEFYPTTVVHKQNNRITTRIQAGPLKTKLDAYRICGKLFDDNMPCFVVEGMNHQAVARNTARQIASAAAPKRNMKPLPWLVEVKPKKLEQEEIHSPPAIREVKPAKNIEEERGLFAWLADNLTFSDDESKGAPQAAEERKPLRKGHVEVGEAIRVPLSGKTKYSPTFGFDTRGKEAEAFSASDYARSHSNTPGWLMVERFRSEHKALLFWRRLVQLDKFKTEGLKMRISRPVQPTRTPRVRLYMGAFTTMAGADSFCRSLVLRIDSDLRCRFLAGKEVEALGVTNDQKEPTRAERYERRRKRASLMNPIQPKRVFWLHVATTNSQMQALKTWDIMRKKHADLLEGLRSSVSATLSRKQAQRYMLRVGPLESGSAAAELCSSLHKRKLFCKVYSNM